MAMMTSFHFSSPFPSPLKKTSHHHHHQERTRAVDPESEAAAETVAPAEADSDSFEDRLKQVRLRYKSGTGKKAELRKSKKSTTSKSGSVLLPPVPLKEPVSRGMKVDFGFSPYTERLNGRLAGLGLTALLLVELGSGKSVLRYHSPAIVFLQIYFVAAVSAVFVKYEKERISIWPRSQSSPPPL
ncbi:hypothetical protein ACHQM5_009983 [Ranunculus cassubicifolius]